MPSRALFERYSDEEISGTLRAAKEQARREIRNNYAMALDFAEGRQAEHVRSELAARYPTRQRAATDGQSLRAVTIPITQRYIAEAATLYDHEVTRTVLNEDGSENEEMTETLRAELDAISYDETLHRVESLQQLLSDVGVWFQVKSGAMRPVIALPQDVYPVAPRDGEHCDPSDQRDYAGFIVQTMIDTSDARSDDQALYALLTPAETVYYTAPRQNPYEPAGPLNRYPNPYRIAQTIDTEDHRGADMVLPVQPFTLWHKQIPVGSLLSFPDADIVAANLELNIQWSLLLDTMRTQGWATPVLNMLNPDQARQHEIPHGAQFPVCIGLGEAFSYASAVAPFAELVAGLKAFLSTLAIAHRQSPNDFSIDAVAPSSGFAKMIDSLPKIEARQECARRMKHTEETIAWPRIAAIGAYLGWEGFTEQSITQASMRVEFANIEFPRTIDEEIRRDEFELKHKITTPARLLAKRAGISIEEAEERIAAEKADGDGNAQSPEQPTDNRNIPPNAQDVKTGLLGRLIAQRTKAAPKEKDDDRAAN